MLDLATTVGDVRVTRGSWSIIETGSPGGVVIDRGTDVRFSVVLEGSAFISVGQAGFVALGVGDAALVGGDPHVIVDDPRSAPVHCNLIDHAHSERRIIPVARVGGSRVALRILHGQCSVNVDSSSWNSLPPLLRFTAGPRAADALPWAVTASHFDASSLEPGAVVIYDRIVELLLIDAIRRRLVSGRAVRPGREDATPQRIAEAMNLMRRRFGETWDLPLLARAVGMSRTAFCIAFRRTSGKTPMQFLTQVRMAEAIRLLEDRDDDISAIAGLVGYESTASFTRAFKKATSSTPLAVRKSKTALGGIDVGSRFQSIIA